MDFKDLIPALVVLLFASTLLVWYSVTKTTEGFESQEGDRCGVDQAPCKFGTKCMNGYCVSPNAPIFPILNDLPVEPSDFKDAGSFLHIE